MTLPGHWRNARQGVWRWRRKERVERGSRRRRLWRRVGRVAPYNGTYGSAGMRRLRGRYAVSRSGATSALVVVERMRITAARRVRATAPFEAQPAFGHLPSTVPLPLLAIQHDRATRAESLDRWETIGGGTYNAWLLSKGRQRCKKIAHCSPASGASRWAPQWTLKYCQALVDEPLSRRLLLLLLPLSRLHTCSLYAFSDSRLHFSWAKMSPLRLVPAQMIEIAKVVNFYIVTFIWSYLHLKFMGLL